MRHRSLPKSLTGLLCAALAMLAVAASAHAQAPAPAPGPATSQASPRAAPFDAELLRLAEILGTLHYLRGICGANEGLRWRNDMQALVDAETPTGERRARMIASFNRGYNGFQQSYRSCTPAASLAIRRYLAEGAKISRDLTARYAN
jgi:uncharacterized protein (TIGR02301 family)